MGQARTETLFTTFIVTQLAGIHIFSRRLLFLKKRRVSLHCISFSRNKRVSSTYHNLTDQGPCTNLGELSDLLENVELPGSSRATLASSAVRLGAP